MPLLDVRDLRVHTDSPDVPILRGLSFQIEPGEHLGIVGESGCGKSMTALALMGLVPRPLRVSGSITFDGADIGNATEAYLCQYRGRGASMIFQEPMTALNPVLTIGDQITEGERLRSSTNNDSMRARLDDVMRRVGLPTDTFSPKLYPHQLSGGQRQRVMIAMALFGQPKLLIADEPTTALDVTVQTQILKTLATTTNDSGAALILISHDLGVVAGMSDRVLVMYAGCVVEGGPTDRVFHRRAHPYTRALFAARPSAIDRAERRRQRLPAIDGRVPEPGDLVSGCAFADRCKSAKDRCLQETPLLQQVDAHHQVACFYPKVATP